MNRGFLCIAYAMLCHSVAYTATIHRFTRTSVLELGKATLSQILLPNNIYRLNIILMAKLQLLAITTLDVRGSIQNVAWMKCKVKYVKPPVHRWLTNVTQYIWEENKKFRSFYFASVASIFIPVDCAVNRETMRDRLKRRRKDCMLLLFLGLKQRLYAPFRWVYSLY